jgi:hypothetical protein
MSSVRRWYVFLVCAVCLQSVVWGAIALLRNLLAASRAVPVTTIALQVSIIVVGLPLLLVHWLWAQRLARQDPDERKDALRRLYIYGTLAALLAPLIANAFDLVTILMRLAFGSPLTTAPVGKAIMRNLAALIVLGAVWSFHQVVAKGDSEIVPEEGNAATVRHLYIFAFSATGLVMTTQAVTSLLRWIMYQITAGATIGQGALVGLSIDLSRLALGLPLWLVFWRWAQALFNSDDEEEQNAALRKLYIYLVVFVSSLTAVANAAVILAGGVRRLLDLPAIGSIRGPLPIVLTMCAVWAFHSYILREDAGRAAGGPRQAAIRRLYLYLVAAVGLSAFLVGLSGVISVLIRSVASAALGTALKEILAWSSSALITGLPVWLVPWRQVQRAAADESSLGVEERRSIVRKIYLYFFLFVATITVLSGGVYILWQLLTIALGGRAEAELATSLAQAIAYVLIGVGVWLYHGSALRGDGRLAGAERLEQLRSLQTVLLDTGESSLGQAVLEGLKRELPDLAVDTIDLALAAEAATPSGAPEGDDRDAMLARLGKADIIIGPWYAALGDVRRTGWPADFSNAVIDSPARKLLFPTWIEGWNWAGVDRRGADSLAKHVVRAVGQIAAGEEVRLQRPLSAGAIIGIIVGALFLLIFLAFPLILFFSDL